MRTNYRAFTLVELLVVIAILVVLAGLLFPVFRGARESANRTACLMNMRQVQQASLIYFDDYDDRFVPVNQHPFVGANSGNDRTWVQLTLPYVRSFAVFRCPSDYSTRPSDETTFDQDLVPGDTLSRYYTASLHVDLGYNYLYLSPVVEGPDGVRVDTRSVSGITDPSRTLMFVDSLWDRTPEGVPTGGGNWIVTPPCRYLPGRGPRSPRRDSFVPEAGADEHVYYAFQGWEPDSTSKLMYGGAWPWHADRMNVVRVDGSVRSFSPKEISSGCDVRSHWSGDIKDVSQYIWDLG